MSATTIDVSSASRLERLAATPPLPRIRSAVVARGRRAERLFFRRALGFGERVRCPICGWHGVQFAPSFKPRRPNRICPRCHSNERYRALEFWLRRHDAIDGTRRLLEIAPIGLVEPTARSMGYRYASLDLASTRALVRGDLCATPFRDESFDLIICFHVLEHIPDDLAAMAEMRRLLTPEGKLLVVVPLDRDLADTFEVPDADPADYERLYGQSDHVRMYGRDVGDRLRAAGLEVDEVLWNDEFTEDVRGRQSLDGDDDRFWICRR